MRLAGTEQDSPVDGPGLRFVIFTQGCLRQCPHCHNSGSWDVNGGTEYTVKQVIRLMKAQIKKQKNLRGVTFSGGEPFLQAAEVAQVAQAAHEMGWDVVTYTGFTYEELLANNNDSVTALLSASDILIDGEYIHELGRGKFCGSSNQRVIDMAKTQQSGGVVLWEEKAP